jgi:hypothetical protein
MPDQRLLRAVARIESALARLESKPVHPVSDRQLAAKAQRLEAETRAAIADIDKLLARMES